MKHLAIIFVCLFCCSFTAQGLASEVVPLVFVPEMEDLPLPQFRLFAYVPRVVATSTIEAFTQEWEALSPNLEPLITAPMIIYLSRWAKQEMVKVQLKSGWIKTLPMKPVGTSAHQPESASFSEKIVFSQEVSEGYPLPSHSPIVFRHLQLYAEFDSEKKKIGRVLITIRGWREE